MAASGFANSSSRRWTATVCATAGLGTSRPVFARSAGRTLPPPSRSSAPTSGAGWTAPSVRSPARHVRSRTVRRRPRVGSHPDRSPGEWRRSAAYRSGYMVREGEARTKFESMAHKTCRIPKKLCAVPPSIDPCAVRSQRTRRPSSELVERRGGIYQGHRGPVRSAGGKGQRRVSGRAWPDPWAILPPASGPFRLRRFRARVEGD